MLLYSIYLIVIFTYPYLLPNNHSLQLINKNDIEHSDIIISGDSRAEFQIDPTLLHEYTHKNCINVAESAFDLFSLTERLKLSTLKNTGFELTDFTDVQHTCIHGNAKFTRIISDILQKTH